MNNQTATEARIKLNEALTTIKRYSEAARDMQNGYVAISVDDAEIIYNEIIRLQNENANLLDRFENKINTLIADNEHIVDNSILKDKQIKKLKEEIFQLNSKIASLTGILNGQKMFVQTLGRAERKRPEVINFDLEWNKNPWDLSLNPIAEQKINDAENAEKFAEAAEQRSRVDLSTGAGASLRFTVEFSIDVGFYVFDNFKKEICEAAVNKFDADRKAKELNGKEAEAEIKPKPAETVGIPRAARFGICNIGTCFGVRDYPAGTDLPFIFGKQQEALDLAKILNSFVAKE